LEQRLNQAQSPREQREWVTGLGNSGHPDAADSIIKQLNSPSIVMRVEALDALRLLPGPEVSRTIAQSMTSDQDASVRVAAIGSARVRAPDEDLARGLLNAWTQDPDESVRKSAGAAIDWIESSHPGFRDRMKQARASL
jgi:HEAT repeat protein